MSDYWQAMYLHELLQLVKVIAVQALHRGGLFRAKHKLRQVLLFAAGFVAALNK